MSNVIGGVCRVPRTRFTVIVFLFDLSERNAVALPLQSASSRTQAMSSPCCLERNSLSEGGYPRPATCFIASGSDASPVTN